MSNQPDNVERIADGLMRLAQVIGSLNTATAVARGLSALQLQMLQLLAQRGGSETVGFFARRFLIKASTVSDSLRVLESRGLVSKRRDHADARVVHIAITPEGREAVAIAAASAEKLKRLVAGWDEGRRAVILPALIDLIDGLQREGAIPVDRMCVACRYFAINCDTDGGSAPYFCRFINAPLRALDLRVDCPDFEPQT
ncbi:MAG TPA: MarR family transcriptional regulator [bacterium]|nr:MarR family transcriptional regulator [bacterium]